MAVTNLATLDSLDKLETFLSQLKAEIGRFGGRYYVHGDGTTFKLNDIVRTFNTIIHSNKNQETDNEKNTSVIKIIRNLDQQAQDLLEGKTSITKFFTFLRQFFSNLFFNRNQILNEIQFPGQKLVTSVGNYRLLTLDGEKGNVSCRVRGISQNDTPTLSEKGIIEFWLRTIPRMRNLVSVRGFEEGTRMIGPCDYFGNLEAYHEYEYTIQIDNGIPAIHQHKKKIVNKEAGKIEDQNLLPPPSTKLKAEWIDGDHAKGSIDENTLGPSLFNSKGVLKISGGTDFELEPFDATKVDLSSFKARLVKNSTPFQICDTIIDRRDDCRVITYFYEPMYADQQIERGGGLFVETHSFPQVITPLDKNSGGFVTLGKWTDETKKEELQLIGVKIPYGYTLVIEPYGIHGDENLDGMYMMCMTSSHESMLTADTVFLKNAESMKNISLTIKNSDEGKEKKVLESLPPIAKFIN